MSVYYKYSTMSEVNIGIDVAGCVLAGGKSRRMGTDKALLTLGGKTLIAAALEGFSGFREILISAGDAERYALFGIPVIVDETPGIGPLGGFTSVLKAAESGFVCFRPVDTPFVPPELHRLVSLGCAGRDAAVPIFQNKTEPLLACFSKTALTVLEGLAESGFLKASEVFSMLDTEYIALETPEILARLGDPAAYLANANDPETFQTFERRF